MNVQSPAWWRFASRLYHQRHNSRRNHGKCSSRKTRKRINTPEGERRKRELASAASIWDGAGETASPLVGAAFEWENRAAQASRADALHLERDVVAASHEANEIEPIHHQAAGILLGLHV